MSKYICAALFASALANNDNAHSRSVTEDDNPFQNEGEVLKNSKPHESAALEATESKVLERRNAMPASMAFHYNEAGERVPGPTEGGVHPAAAAIPGWSEFFDQNAVTADAKHGGLRRKNAMTHGSGDSDDTPECAKTCAHGLLAAPSLVGGFVGGPFACDELQTMITGCASSCPQSLAEEYVTKYQCASYLNEVYGTSYHQESGGGLRRKNANVLPGDFILPDTNGGLRRKNAMTHMDEVSGDFILPDTNGGLRRKNANVLPGDFILPDTNGGLRRKNARGGLHRKNTHMDPKGLQRSDHVEDYVQR